MNFKAAVFRYAKKWTKVVSVDRCVLRDREETAYEFIDENNKCLKQRQSKRERSMFLKAE